MNRTVQNTVYQAHQPGTCQFFRCVIRLHAGRKHLGVFRPRQRRRHGTRTGGKGLAVMLHIAFMRQNTHPRTAGNRLVTAEPVVNRSHGDPQLGCYILAACIRCLQPVAYFHQFIRPIFAMACHAATIAGQRCGVKAIQPIKAFQPLRFHPFPPQTGVFSPFFDRFFGGGWKQNVHHTHSSLHPSERGITKRCAENVKITFSL